jgi:RHS repeat-associated protein
MVNKNYLITVSIWMLALIVSLPIIFAESLSYDQNGNLISGDGRYREYDDWNNLERIRDGNTVSDPVMEEYIYDEEGIRLLTIKYNSSGYITEKIYTPSREFSMVQNLSGRFNFTYIYAGDVLVARLNPDGSKFYYHPDALGSTNLITDNDGNVVEKTFHTPYGELDNSNPVEETRVGYTGHELDEDTGQVYMKARYYCPWLKMFCQPDPIIQNPYNSQNLNRYSYTLNNPYRYKDPTGHVSWNIVAGAALTFVGAVALTVSAIAASPAIAAVGIVVGLTTIGLSAGALALGIQAEKEHDITTDLTAEALSNPAAIVALGFQDPDKTDEERLESLKRVNNFYDIGSLAIGGIPNSIAKYIETGSTIGSLLHRSYQPNQQYIENQREAVRQQIIMQRREGSYSGGPGYNPQAGAYVSPDGHVYPTTDPDWEPCGCATNQPPSNND